MHSDSRDDQTCLGQRRRVRPRESRRCSESCQIASCVGRANDFAANRLDRRAGIVVFIWLKLPQARWTSGRVLASGPRPDFCYGGIPHGVHSRRPTAPDPNPRDRVSPPPQFLGAPYFSPRSTLRIASSKVSVMSLLVT